MAGRAAGAAAQEHATVCRHADRGSGCDEWPHPGHLEPQALSTLRGRRAGRRGLERALAVDVDEQGVLAREDPRLVYGYADAGGGLVARIGVERQAVLLRVPDGIQADESTTWGSLGRRCRGLLAAGLARRAGPRRLLGRRLLRRGLLGAPRLPLVGLFPVAGLLRCLLGRLALRAPLEAHLLL